jgi:hypothetical protein
MAKPRRLTAGEIALARAAFGGRIDYARVRLRDGPGVHPFALAAFANGNPAITVGSTVYFKQDYSPDFAAPGQNRESFIHEMTHVWQYHEMGSLAFFSRYLAEFARSGRKAGKMYEYGEEERFADAMLEAQAEMVGDYSAALWADKTDAAAAARKAKLAGNLAGSRVYGL